ncbi:DUF1049 domain-containing protein [Denitromonas halophila]|uniref:DUF1049 domain-containing protein n=2 Tax=Denitromonas halophila TaxID=1629404 RepID=A0A557QGH7_9RHOO|nr:DUF1049 domain-containing protein [Denitromonas halophila]
MNTSHRATSPTARQSWRAKMRNVLLAVSVVLAAVFALQNFHSVELSFVIWRFETTLSVALLLALVLGVLIGALAMLPWTLRTRKEVRQVRHQLADAAAHPAPARPPSVPPKSPIQDQPR